MVKYLLQGTNHHDETDKTMNEIMATIKDLASEATDTSDREGMFLAWLLIATALLMVSLVVMLVLAALGGDLSASGDTSGTCHPVLIGKTMVVICS